MLLLPVSHRKNNVNDEISKFSWKKIRRRNLITLNTRNDFSSLNDFNHHQTLKVPFWLAVVRRHRRSWHRRWFRGRVLRSPKRSRCRPWQIHLWLLQVRKVSHLWELHLLALRILRKQFSAAIAHHERESSVALCDPCVSNDTGRKYSRISSLWGNTF